MANDYTVPSSDEIYMGQINDSESDIASLLGLCQVGIANDNGLLVYKNNLDEAFKALRGEDLLSGYIMIPSDENINVLERTALYSNGYDLRLPDNRYIGCEAYPNMLRLLDSNTLTVDANELVTGTLIVNDDIVMADDTYLGCSSDPGLVTVSNGEFNISGVLKLSNGGHTAEFILSDTGVLTIEIDGIDQGVEYYNE